MRALVTGAAGFIGTNFVRFVLGEGAASALRVERLVAVDLLTYAGNYANLADLGGDPRFRFVRADVSDAPAMADLVRTEGIDTVVHFAAESHVDRSIVDHAPFVRTNVQGTLALLDAIRDVQGFRRFLHVSTDEVYGSIADGRASETWATCPSSPYAASKAAADAFVQAHAATHGIPAVITRRVSWKRHSWCAAVGQISASSRGYSAEPSVMTCSGWIPAAARRRRKAAVVAWSTAPCTNW